MGESDDGQAPDEAAAGETQTGDGVEPVGDDAAVEDVEPVGVEPLEDESVGLEPVDDAGAVVDTVPGPDDSGEEAEAEPDEPAREATTG